MTSDYSFHYEVEKPESDEQGIKVTTVKCHGRMVAEYSREMHDSLKPLIHLGGRIVIDLGDVNYLDSAGLGALIGLKVSAVKQPFFCRVELANMTPRVLEVLRITNLEQL